MYMFYAVMFQEKPTYSDDHQRKMFEEKTKENKILIKNLLIM